MAVEEIVLHCLISLTTLAIGVLMYQVWKYLNSKPLGLQTVLDDLTKDGMIILGLTITYEWITWIKFASVYSHDAAMIITKINAFFRVSLMVQAFTFSVTRYLFVFSFQYINNVSEENIKLASRICVVVLAMTSATVDDWTTGKKFSYLTENYQFDKTQGNESKPLFSFIVVITSLLIVAIVQARIAYKRSKYPELQNNVGENDTYNLKMISVAVVLSIFMIIIILSSLYAKILLWKSLLIVLCVRIMVLLMILLTIYSNERMYLFIENNLMPFQVYLDPEIAHVNPAPTAESPVQQSIQSSQYSLNQLPIENPSIIPQPIHPKTNKNSSDLSLKVLSESTHQLSTLPDICV